MIRIRYLMLGAAAAVIAVAAWDRSVVAQPAAVPGPIATSISQCKNCHSGAESPGARDFVSKYKSHEFIRLDESLQWEQHDPHSKAFAVLKTPLGKRMAE